MAFVSDERINSSYKECRKQSTPAASLRTSQWKSCGNPIKSSKTSSHFFFKFGSNFKPPSSSSTILCFSSAVICFWCVGARVQNLNWRRVTSQIVTNVTQVSNEGAILIAFDCPFIIVILISQRRDVKRTAATINLLRSSNGDNTRPKLSQNPITYLFLFFLCVSALASSFRFCCNGKWSVKKIFHECVVIDVRHTPKYNCYCTIRVHQLHFTLGARACPTAHRSLHTFGQSIGMVNSVRGNTKQCKIDKTCSACAQTNFTCLKLKFGCFQIL